MADEPVARTGSVGPTGPKKLGKPKITSVKSGVRKDGKGFIRITVEPPPSPPKPT